MLLSSALNVLELLDQLGTGKQKLNETGLQDYAGVYQVIPTSSNHFIRKCAVTSHSDLQPDGWRDKMTKGPATKQMDKASPIQNFHIPATAPAALSSMNNEIPTIDQLWHMSIALLF